MCEGVAVWVRELRFVCYIVWQLLCIGIVVCGSCDVGELWCVGVVLRWSQCGGHGESPLVIHCVFSVFCLCRVFCMFGEEK